MAFDITGYPAGASTFDIDLSSGANEVFSGSIAVEAAGSIVVATSSVEAFSGAISADNVVVAAVTGYQSVTSGGLDQGASGSIDISTSHTDTKSGDILLAMSETIDIAQTHVDTFSSAILGSVSSDISVTGYQSVGSGGLNLDAVGEVIISSAIPNVQSGALVLSNASEILVSQSDVITFSGNLELTGVTDISVNARQDVNVTGIVSSAISEIQINGFVNISTQIQISATSDISINAFQEVFSGSFLLEAIGSIEADGIDEGGSVYSGHLEASAISAIELNSTHIDAFSGSITTDTVGVISIQNSEQHSFTNILITSQGDIVVSARADIFSGQLSISANSLLELVSALVNTFSGNIYTNNISGIFVQNTEHDIIAVILLTGQSSISVLSQVDSFSDQITVEGYFLVEVNGIWIPAFIQGPVPLDRTYIIELKSRKATTLRNERTLTMERAIRTVIAEDVTREIDQDIRLREYVVPE